MSFKFSRIFIAILASAALVNACRKADVVLPDNVVSFSTSSQSLNNTDDSINVRLVLSRAADRNIDIVVDFSTENLVYGIDFATSPAVTNNQLHLTIPSGSAETKFTVKKIAGKLYEGDEKVKFTIYSSTNPVVIGTQKEATVSFVEVLSQSANDVIDGGGPTYGNKVFLDLSSNRQTPVLRTSWDLGFYSGAENRVILNSSTAMMARATTKTNINDVTAADTVGISSLVTFSLYAPNPLSMPYIDYPDGDLTKTAFAAVSTNPDENFVYLVNRGTGVGSPAPLRGWEKVKVTMVDGKYKVQYAPLNATTFSEATIEKESSYNFNYLSFDNGKLNVEPEKDSWDLAWTYFSNVTDFGGGEVPYLYQDMMLSNRGVQVAKVMEADVAFDAFAEANLATISYHTGQTGIGADWRSGGGPSSSPAVKNDRYYIVKDTKNNIYKLKFTALTQNGQRGYPAFTAKLVKAGS